MKMHNEIERDAPLTTERAALVAWNQPDDETCVDCKEA